ncbi:hypothetical protein BN871_HA_00060 [Paenibacillus sp. P22]|nr:hypothetical protein BN871_HA_00060 [Paenibacillus sp. P22]
MEQVEFLGGQLDAASAAHRFAGIQVENEIFEGQPVARLLQLVRLAAQQRAHPREQLLERERLHQIIVRAEIEPLHAVMDIVLGGQHQDRHGAAAFPDAPAYFPAVHLRHHDIKDQQLRIGSEQRLQPFQPVAGRRDLVSLERQAAAQHGCNLLVIVYHHDMRSHGPAPLACSLILSYLSRRRIENRSRSVPLPRRGGHNRSAGVTTPALRNNRTFAVRLFDVVLALVADLDRDVHLLAVADDVHRHLVADFFLLDDRDQIFLRFVLRSVHAGDDVILLQARLVGRSIERRFPDDGAFRAAEAELLLHLVRDVSQRRADERAWSRALAGLQLIHDFLDRARRNREADALRVRADGGIDADDFAVHVDQRTAGVAGVDGGVRLQQMLVVPSGAAGFRSDLDRTLAGAEHAYRNGMIEAVRVADSDEPVADAAGFGVAERQRREVLAVLRLYLEHGEIEILAGSEQLRFQLLGRALHLDLDLLRAVDDVLVRQNIAVLLEEESGAEPRLLKLSALLAAAAAASSELVAEELAEERIAVEAAAVRAAGVAVGRDQDDRRRSFFRYLRDVHRTGRVGRRGNLAGSRRVVSLARYDARRGQRLSLREPVVLIRRPHQAADCDYAGEEGNRRGAEASSAPLAAASAAGLPFALACMGGRYERAQLAGRRHDDLARMTLLRALLGSAVAPGRLPFPARLLPIRLSLAEGAVRIVVRGAFLALAAGVVRRILFCALLVFLVLFVPESVEPAVAIAIVFHRKFLLDSMK